MNRTHVCLVVALAAVGVWLWCRCNCKRRDGFVSRDAGIGNVNGSSRPYIPANYVKYPNGDDAVSDEMVDTVYARLPSRQLPGNLASLTASWYPGDRMECMEQCARRQSGWLDMDCVNKCNEMFQI